MVKLRRITAVGQVFLGTDSDSSSLTDGSLFGHHQYLWSHQRVRPRGTQRQSGHAQVFLPKTVINSTWMWGWRGCVCHKSSETHSNTRTETEVWTYHYQSDLVQGRVWRQIPNSKEKLNFAPSVIFPNRKKTITCFLFHRIAI